MNEALTRAQLIDPVLIDKGWKAGFCQECYWIPEEVFPRVRVSGTSDRVAVIE